MSVVKKHDVTIAELNSSANSGALYAGDFYVVANDSTYQAISRRAFIKIQQAQEPEPLPDLGTAAFEDVGAFATAEQGGKADTAIQEVKTINGQSIVGVGDFLINTNAAVWVSGTTYPIGTYVISPLSWHQYIRKTNGAGAVDPANDKMNWQLAGPGGIKSIQRGTTNATIAATVTISAVDPANSVVSLLGQSSTDASFIHAVRISLESPTILRVYRAGGGTGITVTASWQVVEYWS